MTGIGCIYRWINRCLIVCQIIDLVHSIMDCGALSLRLYTKLFAAYDVLLCIKFGCQIGIMNLKICKFEFGIKCIRIWRQLYNTIWNSWRGKPLNQEFSGFIWAGFRRIRIQSSLLNKDHEFSPRGLTHVKYMNTFFALQLYKF
jgi:hypothetical protein